MSEKVEKEKMKKRCNHLYCIRPASHDLPHKDKYGNKWSKKICVSPDCHNRGDLSEFGELLGGRWTPCCRNIRWWNEDGTLGGNKYELVTCAKCRLVMAVVEIEPILRKKKGSRPPPIFHDKCRDDARPGLFKTFPEQETHDELLEQFKTCVMWHLLEGKFDRERPEFSNLPEALSRSAMDLLKIKSDNESASPEKLLELMKSHNSELFWRKEKARKERLKDAPLKG